MVFTKRQMWYLQRDKCGIYKETNVVFTKRQMWYLQRDKCGIYKETNVTCNQ